MSPIAFNTVALCLSFSFRLHLNVAKKCNVFVSTLHGLIKLPKDFAIYHIAHVTVFEREGLRRSLFMNGSNAVFIGMAFS